MKKCILVILVALLAGIPGVLNAAEDRYGSGMRNANPDAGIDLGKQVFTFPPANESTYESEKKVVEKQKETLDKKVDDAINKAWGKAQ